MPANTTQKVPEGEINTKEATAQEEEKKNRVEQNTMDINKGKDKYCGKGRQTGYWEDMTTSHGKRNTISCTDWYYKENKGTANRDREIYRQRNKDQVTRGRKQRTDTDRDGGYPWRDHHRNDYDPHSQETHWYRESAQYRGQNRIRQEYPRKHFKQIEYGIFYQKGYWTGATVYFKN